MYRLLSALLVHLLISSTAWSQTLDLEGEIETDPVGVVQARSIPKNAKSGMPEEDIQRLFEKVEQAFSVITSDGSDEPCFFGCDGGIVGNSPTFIGTDYRKFAAHVMLANLAADLGYLREARDHVKKAEILFLRDLDAMKMSDGFKSSMHGWGQHWGCQPSRVSPRAAAADLAYVARQSGLLDLADRTEPNWKVRLDQPREHELVRVLVYLPDVSY